MSRKEAKVIRLRPIRSTGTMEERMDALDHNQKAIAEALEEIAESQTTTNRILRKLVRLISNQD